MGSGGLAPAFPAMSPDLGSGQPESAPTPFYREGKRAFPEQWGNSVWLRPGLQGAQQSWGAAGVTGFSDFISLGNRPDDMGQQVTRTELVLGPRATRSGHCQLCGLGSSAHYSPLEDSGLSELNNIPQVWGGAAPDLSPNEAGVSPMSRGKYRVAQKGGGAQGYALDINQHF